MKRHKPENHLTHSFIRATPESGQAPKAPLLDGEISHLIGGQLKKEKKLINTKGSRFWEAGSPQLGRVLHPLAGMR
jgi:hypothetical protein